jgi:hypothetical protein
MAGTVARPTPFLQAGKTGILSLAQRRGVAVWHTRAKFMLRAGEKRLAPPSRQARRYTGPVRAQAYEARERPYGNGTNFASPVRSVNV